MRSHHHDLYQTRRKWSLDPIDVPPLKFGQEWPQNCPLFQKNSMFCSSQLIIRLFKAYTKIPMDKKGPKIHFKWRFPTKIDAFRPRGWSDFCWLYWEKWKEKCVTNFLWKLFLRFFIWLHDSGKMVWLKGFVNTVTVSTLCNYNNVKDS